MTLIEAIKSGKRFRHKDWLTNVLIDPEDQSLLNNFKWHLCQGYIRRTRQKKDGPGAKSVWLAREILQAPKGAQVDHIDGNPLNNKRSNLRLVTNAQNRLNMKLDKRNKLGFKGVSVCRNTGKYQARIAINKQQIYLGNFDTPQKAADAYNKAAEELHGVYGRLNKINYEEEKIEITRSQLLEALKKSYGYREDYKEETFKILREEMFLKELGFK